MGIVCKVPSCAYKEDKSNCILKNIILSDEGFCVYYNAVDYNRIKTIEHYNVYDSDIMHPDGGRCDRGVYCRMQHKVIKKLDKCPCPLMSGAAQGHGIECAWDDVFMNDSGGKFDPKAEFLRVSHLIDIGILDRNPSRGGKIYLPDMYLLPQNEQS